jgi:hypothetical protein
MSRKATRCVQGRRRGDGTIDSRLPDVAVTRAVCTLSAECGGWLMMDPSRRAAELRSAVVARRRHVPLCVGRVVAANRRAVRAPSSCSCCLQAACPFSTTASVVARSLAPMSDSPSSSSAPLESHRQCHRRQSQHPAAVRSKRHKQQLDRGPILSSQVKPPLSHSFVACAISPIVFDSDYRHSVIVRRLSSIVSAFGRIDRLSICCLYSCDR